MCSLLFSSRSSPNAVFKSVVRCCWVNMVTSTQLLDISKPIELRCVYHFQNCIWKLYHSVHRTAEHLHIDEKKGFANSMYLHSKDVAVSISTNFYYEQKCMQLIKDLFLLTTRWALPSHRRTQGGARVQALLKFFAYLVILGFEKRSPNQKYCSLPKVKHFDHPIFCPPKKLLGWLHHCGTLLEESILGSAFIHVRWFKLVWTHLLFYTWR